MIVEVHSAALDCSMYSTWTISFFTQFCSKSPWFKMQSLFLNPGSSHYFSKCLSFNSKYQLLSRFKFANNAIRRETIKFVSIFFVFDSLVEKCMSKQWRQSSQISFFSFFFGRRRYFIWKGNGGYYLNWTLACILEKASFKWNGMFIHN